MAKQHIRLNVGIFNHNLFLSLPSKRKGDCLSVLIVLLRFTNFKTGLCYPRYAKIKELTGYSESKIKIIINILVRNSFIMKKRLSSSNLYKINSEFIHKSERSDSHNLTGDSQNLPIRQSDSSSINKTNIIKTSIIELSNKNLIDKIVSSKDIDKDNKILKLASLPLPELKQCISNHPYYIRKAIELKEQELRDARAVPKHIVEQAMTAAVSKNAKNRSFNYRKKIEFNKRNNLDWQGKPKK
jgi:hypothetical protein